MRPLIQNNLLGPQVDETNRLTGGTDYVDYTPGADNDLICLDGYFSVEELEAMAEHIRACQKYAGRE